MHPPVANYMLNSKYGNIEAITLQTGLFKNLMLVNFALKLRRLTFYVRRPAAK